MEPDPANGRVCAARYVLAVSSLLWIAQAACLAYAVGALVDGAGFAGVLAPAVFFMGTGLLKSLLEALGNRMAFRQARAELTRLRVTAAEALSRHSPLDPDRPASGAVASVLGEQAELIVPYLGRFNPARFKAIIVPTVILLFVLPISWLTALLLLVAAPLIPLFMALIGWRAKAESENQLASTGGLNGFLLDRLRGVSTLRTLGAIDATALELRRNALSLKERTMAVLRIAFLSSAALELVSAVGVAMVAVYVGFSLLGEIHVGAWGGTMTIRTGLFLLLLAPAFFEPLRELSAAWHDRAAGEAAMRALESLGRSALVPDPCPASWQAAEPGDTADGIAFRDVCFRYTKERPLVLDGACLLANPGEHVALFGESGAGKSTILALAAGLAFAERGDIAIGGVPITPANADSLRRRIAWIGQKPHIFAGSIAANVALGRKDAGPAAIAGALELARLGPVAAAYGRRSLGEGGIGLSGGEAVRLAIARAAVDPHVRIIVADEPTAHLDSTTASEVTESLLALAGGRTLLVATHDPVLIARMDRTIDLDARKRIEIREAAE